MTYFIDRRPNAKHKKRGQSAALFGALPQAHQALGGGGGQPPLHHRHGARRENIDSHQGHFRTRVSARPGWGTQHRLAG